MYKLYGMIPAMPTPFKEDSSIDYDGVKRLLNHLIDGGVHAILVGGSTGEYSLMTPEERRSLIKTACEEANGRVPIIAGTGCHRPEDTIALTQYAAEVGADAALVLPPYYMQTSRQGIIDYFKTVAENSPIGIVIYNYPSATGVDLDPELIFELSKIDKIVGLKDTADLEHTCKVIALTKDNENFGVVNGFEHLIMGTLASGGDGTMGIVHNLAPREMVRIYDLIVKENNLAEALKISQRLTPLYTYMEEEPFPGPVKAALDIMGLPGGLPRRPITPPSDAMKEKLEKALKEAGLI